MMSERGRRIRERVPCPICKQLFHPTYLSIHKRIHTGDKPYQCSICNKRFMFHSGILYHNKREHNEQMKTRGPLQYNYITHGQTGGIFTAKCTICMKLFPNKSALRAHGRIHNRDGWTPFECSRCFKRFMYSKTFENHTSTCTERAEQNRDDPTRSEMTVKCLHCSKTFQNDNQLADHMRVHNTEKLLVRCTQCFKFFRNNELLTAHKLTAHVRNEDETPAFTCHKCGKQFSKKFRLDMHMRSHHKPRGTSFQPSHEIKKPSEPQKRTNRCSICCKLCADKESLALHVKIHSNSRFHCPVCSAGFARRQHLEIHSRIHEDVEGRPYKCTQCRAGFMKEYKCRMHMNRIHNIGFDEYLVAKGKREVHECVMCWTVLDTQHALVNHMKTHTKIRKHNTTTDSKQMDLDRPSSDIYSSKQENNTDIIAGHEEDSTAWSKTTPPNIRAINESILERYYVDSASLTNTSIDKVTGRTVFLCDVCQIPFTVKENLKRHIKNRAFDHSVYLTKGPEPMNNRRKKSKSTVEVEKESNLPHSEQPSVTNVSTGSGNNQTNMRLMKLYKYVCDVCGLSYTRKLNMRQHRNKHTDEAFERAGVRREHPTQGEVDNVQSHDTGPTTPQTDHKKTSRTGRYVGFDVYVDTDEVPDYDEFTDTSTSESVVQVDGRQINATTDEPKYEPMNECEEPKHIAGETIDSQNASNDAAASVSVAIARNEKSNNGCDAKPEPSTTSSTEKIGEGKLHVCPGCTLPVLEGQNTIVCQLCCSRFCITCSSIPRSLYDIAFTSDSDPAVVWLCKICRPLFPKFTVLLHQLGEFEESIDERISNLEKKLVSIKTDKQLLMGHTTIQKKDM